MPTCPLERDIIFSAAPGTLQIQIPFLPTPPTPPYGMGAKGCVFLVALPTEGECEKNAGGEEGVTMVMITVRMEEASEAAAPHASRQLLLLGLCGGDVL